MIIDKLIEIAKGAYIKVMGVEKWNSLDDDQKHDVIMMMLKDSLKAIDKIERF